MSAASEAPTCLVCKAPLSAASTRCGHRDGRAGTRAARTPRGRVLFTLLLLIPVIAFLGAVAAWPWTGARIPPWGENAKAVDLTLGYSRYSICVQRMRSKKEVHELIVSRSPCEEVIKHLDSLSGIAVERFQAANRDWKPIGTPYTAPGREPSAKAEAVRKFLSVVISATAIWVAFIALGALSRLSSRLFGGGRPGA